jgi:uncharacterized protein
VAKFRQITWAEFGELSVELVELIRSRGAQPDLVIGIARGGIPVAMVISDEIGAGIDYVKVKSYEGFSRRKPPRILSTLTEEIMGRRVLVVDDLVDEGATMLTVTKYLRRRKPGAMQTAVLFKKPWSSFEPDFYLETLSEWVVFPWEHGETARVVDGQNRDHRRDSGLSSANGGSRSRSRAGSI